MQLTVNQLVVGSIPASGATIIEVNMSDGGKGSKPRPISVSNEEYAARWDAIFAKPLPDDAERALQQMVDFNQVNGLYDTNPRDGNDES